MITLQPSIAPPAATAGVGTANATRGEDTAQDPDFAALMAGMLPDSSPGVAAGVNDMNKDTREGKSGTAGDGSGAVDAQAAEAAPGREGQAAGAGSGLAAQIEGAIALEYAIAPPAPAASRTDAAPRDSASIQSSNGAKPAGWQGLSITSSRAAADAPGARGPGKELHATELPGKPAAADAQRPPAMASPFDGSTPDTVPASEAAALASPATGDTQSARHAEFQALQLEPRASGHAPPSAAHAARLDAPLGSARWREDFAAHISVMLRDATTQAEIRVTPPELGPIQARISVDNGIATVALSAPAPETRDALEAALATLRERLAGSGIALGEASVSDGHSARFEDRAPLPNGHAARTGDRPEQSEDRAARDAPGRLLRIEGLIDLYA